MMRLLVTAGPTREYLDTVRFLSNASSGKLGYAIASAAAARGHSVILVSGPVDLPRPEGVEVIRVVSAAEMLEQSLAAFERCDAAVMAAAVSDFRPKHRMAQKLAKGRQVPTLELEPTEDICARLGRIKDRRIVVGFALEDHDHRAHAHSKLIAKNCDAIICNDIGNLNSDRAAIEVLRRDTGWQGPFSGSKLQVAEKIVELLEALTLPGSS